jgi:hypothetical protein
MIELTNDLDFDTVKNLDSIKVFRSSAKLNKRTYNVGCHFGTKQQALIRADYMVNDEQLYYKYYLYELEIKLGNVWPMLEFDDGFNHGSDYYLDMVKKFDTVIYKNQGEGNTNTHNLSIVILNNKSIKSNKMVKVLSKSYLSNIQNELYT